MNDRPGRLDEGFQHPDSNGLQSPPAEVYNAIKSNNTELLENLLSNQSLDLTAALDNNTNVTVLHQAAISSKTGVLPIVLAALQRVGKMDQALSSRDQNGSTPLALAASNQRYFENFSALLNASEVNIPEVIQCKDSYGNNLVHVAVGGRCVPALRVLVTRDDIQGCLLEMNTRSSTPLQEAKIQLRVNQNQLQMERVNFENRATSLKWDAFARQFHERAQLNRIMETVEALKDIVATLEQPTVEAKVAAAAQAAAEAFKQKEETRRREIRDNCIEMLDKSDWPNLLMLLTSRDAIQQTTALEMVYSAAREGNVDESSLPVLSEEDFQALGALIVSGNDCSRLHVVSLLRLCCLEQRNQSSLPKQEAIMNGLLSLLRSLNFEIQSMCLNIVHTLVINHTFQAKQWIQSLHLLKSYSSSSKLRRSAGEILTCLQDESSVDPGSWTVEDVAAWLDGKEELQDKAVYCKQFLESGIDGLHLLELTHEDMKGLGVRHLSDRRKIATYVDDLRRLNAPSVVGKRDIFLSYAHVNIAFARKLRNALTGASYSVWIDEAGIRAGAKWRDAIANGIENCKTFVYVMTPSLAEEHKKPIFNVILEDVPMSSMDPGLKLVISRRQWTFFTDESKFEESFEKLVTGIRKAIGTGRLSEKNCEDDVFIKRETSTSTSENEARMAVSVTHSLSEDMSKDTEIDLAAKVAKLEVRVKHLEGELERMKGLETSVEELKQLLRTS